MPAAHIHLNGRPHTLPAAISIAGLLASLDMADKPVVVELDQHAVLPRDYVDTIIRDGCYVEIVAIAAGG